MVNGIKPGQSDNNEIDRDDEIEQPRDDQYQDAGNERDDGRNGNGEMHGGILEWFVLGASRARLSIRPTPALSSLETLKWASWSGDRGSGLLQAHLEELDPRVCRSHNP